MIALLADHNLEGQARLLLGTLQTLGWVDLQDIHMLSFAEAGLSEDSSDRVVWQRSQELGALLLTDNRNNEGPDSLEQTLLEEATATSLPVLTVSSAERLRRNRSYRYACAERIAEIMVELERYMGIPRIYLP